MKPIKIKLHNKAANGSCKGKTYRMVEDGDNYIPRDCAFPLAALAETHGGKFKKSNGGKA